MKKTSVLLLLLAVALTGCASSSQNTNANGKVPEPDIEIVQTSSMPVTAQHMTGGMPVQFRLTVTNNAGIPITLKQAELQSIGDGAYVIPARRQGFNKIIAPGATEEMNFTMATTAVSSIAGNNGAVALRVTSIFDSVEGGFQKVITRQVGGYSNQ